MVEQPAGTVTLVFTDIEGSTRLLHELGQDAYRDALAEHRRALREAFERHGGYEVDYEGDAFFVAFPDAGEAVAAASEAQAALEGGPIVVRMGLHTGRPILDPPKYVGLDVHLAARIMSAGHGGQVLLSKVTRDLVDADVTELGEHRLKDIHMPVPLFQLGSERFPPLKTISNTNLPRPASSFVGRESEIGEVGALVREARLVTLTGPGGTGKTRLAIETAAELIGEFKAGVFWVGLAAVHDPALVVETIVQTLGAKEALAAHIGERELLLLLDNFEQVVDAAPELSSLVRACPNLSVLVTSRELLRIDGEVGYPVPTLAEAEAVELFCARSRLQPDATVAELCRRLDDLPLAVELAAARTSVLMPTQILERLGQRLDLLKGGRDVDPRQQTLRATIEWSHDLLSSDEQQLFARLAVFAGGSTLEAAEEVADASLDGLQSLVDKSLVRHTDGRFWMLETIREFALEHLEARHDAAELRSKHAACFLALSQAGGSPERLELELDNFRQALDSLELSDDFVARLQLCAALGEFWYLGGHLREGSARFEQALAADSRDEGARLKALYSASLLAHRLGEYDRAFDLTEERLALARRRGDSEAIAGALLGLGLMNLARGDLDASASAYAQCVELARAGVYTEILAMAINNLGDLALAQGDYESAASHFEESLSIFRSLGARKGIAAGLSNLGAVAVHTGRFDEAEPLLSEGLRLAHGLNDVEVMIWSFGGLSAVAAGRNDARRAATLLGVVDALRDETGHREQLDERQLREEAIRGAVAVLGIERFALAREEGRAMALEEAIGYALGSID